jgi:hypothetical protein
MNLLRNGTIRPGCRWQTRNALEGQAALTVRANQHQPVVPPGIRVTEGRRLVARAVPQTQKLAVELGQLPGIFAVEDGLDQVKGLVIRGHVLVSDPVMALGATG